MQYNFEVESTDINNQAIVLICMRYVDTDLNDI